MKINNTIDNLFINIQNPNDYDNIINLLYGYENKDKIRFNDNNPYNLQKDNVYFVNDIE